MALKVTEKRQRKFDRMLARFNKQTWQKCRSDVAKTFQAMIRMEAADDDGDCVCVTCLRVHQWNSGKINAGHFHSRRHTGTLWDERNCHPQCVYCNQFLSGNIQSYAQYMLETYSEQELVELSRKTKEEINYTLAELVEIRMGFMDRIKVQKKRLA